MNPQLVEGNFGHGGLGHFIKPTDWKYANLVPKSSLPFDWSVGYDVENDLSTVLGIPNFSMPRENQGQSGSCGGQAIRYYDQVLKAFASKSFTHRSAKFPYSQVFQPGGGSFGGDLMSFVKNNGVSTEVLCPSYQNDQPPTEAFMEQSSDVTQAARDDAKNAESSGYAFILDFDIDVLAQAARDNKGIIIGIQGQNNGTWLSSYPKPPFVAQWAHWLYVKGAVMINGQKYLIVINSWGNSIGVNGCQFISEDYVNSGFLQLGMTMVFGPHAYTFTKDLFLGMTDADVFFLQKRLNQDPATIIAPSGAGSPGNETYYFGAKTLDAVIRFQNKYGITPAVGYVGAKTRATLNA